MKRMQYHSISVSFETERNVTYTGVLNLTLDEPRVGVDQGAVRGATSLDQQEEYDQTGAAYYVIAVVLVYGLSMVLLIGSLAKKKISDKEREGEERQIHNYLHQVPSLKEQSARDSYKQLKRSVIRMVSEPSALGAEDTEESETGDSRGETGSGQGDDAEGAAALDSSSPKKVSFFMGADSPESVKSLRRALIKPTVATRPPGTAVPVAGSWPPGSGRAVWITQPAPRRSDTPDQSPDRTDPSGHPLSPFKYPISLPRSIDSPGSASASSTGSPASTACLLNNNSYPFKLMLPCRDGDTDPAGVTGAQSTQSTPDSGHSAGMPPKPESAVRSPTLPGSVVSSPLHISPTTSPCDVSPSDHSVQDEPLRVTCL